MKYDPHDATDAAFTPLPDGDYTFTVTGAEETVSKAGNEMIALRLAFDVDREKPLTVYDNLVATPAALWTTKQFCASTGLDFNAGCLSADDCVGHSGVAHLALGATNSKGKRYMEVAYYVAKAGFSESPKKTAQTQGAAVADAMDEQGPPVEYAEDGQPIPF